MKNTASLAMGGRDLSGHQKSSENRCRNAQKRRGFNQVVF